MILALASSYLDQPIPGELVAIGEVGLTGELRHVSHLEQRLAEVQRLGMKTCIIPAQKLEKTFTDLNVIPAANIGQALRAFLNGPTAKPRTRKE